MYGVVDIGGKKVPMLANAATPFRYKQLFKKDLLRILIKNADIDDRRRRALDDKAEEFRASHTPEEVKRLINEKKSLIEEELKRQEEITGQQSDMDDVKKYSAAVDALAQDLLEPEQIEEFEAAAYASYETAQKLAYIMAAQAAAQKPSDMARISEDTFFDWLAQFEPHTIEAAADEIMAIYNGNYEGDPEIEPKKEGASSTETITQQSSF